MITREDRECHGCRQEMTTPKLTLIRHRGERWSVTLEFHSYECLKEWFMKQTPVAIGWITEPS